MGATAGRRGALLALLAGVTLQCVATRSVLAALGPTQAISGRAIVLAVEHGKASRAAHRLVMLEADSGERVRLLEPQGGRVLAGLRTGQRVVVRGAAADGPGAAAGKGSSAGRAFLAAAVRHIGPSRAGGRPAAAVGPRLIKVGGATYSQLNSLPQRDMPTLFVPIAAVDRVSGAACPGTSLPRMGVAAVRRSVFAELNPRGPTVGALFNQCSLGTTAINMNNSAVADMVWLPCGTATTGLSFSTCEFADFDAWANAADFRLQARGVDLSAYPTRVYLLPPGPCAWVGIAMVGCDGYAPCRAWITGDSWGTPQAVAHELGHTLGLGHAGGPRPDGVVDEYDDQVSVMGYCCEPRCPNTPQAWQLGWLQVQQLDGAALAPGVPVAVRLAPQGMASRSGLRVLPDWAAAPCDPVFAGYRVAVGGDTWLQPSSTGRVHVHTAAIAQPNDAQPTMWQAALAVGESWEHAASGLVLHFNRVANGTALVTACRKTGAETAASCAAGRDNDCNGLAGTADPACTKFAWKRQAAP